MIDRDSSKVWVELSRMNGVVGHIGPLRVLNAFEDYCCDGEGNNTGPKPVVFDRNIGGNRRFYLMVARGGEHLGGTDWNDEVGMVYSEHGVVAGYGFGFGPVVEIVNGEGTVIPEHVTFDHQDFAHAVDPAKYDPLAEGQCFSHCAGVRARQLVMEFGLENVLGEVLDESQREAFSGFGVAGLQRYTLLTDAEKSVVVPTDFYKLMHDLFVDVQNTGRVYPRLNRIEYREIGLQGASLLHMLLRGEDDKDAVKDLLMLQLGIEHANMMTNMFLGFMLKLEKEVREKHFPGRVFNYFGS